MVVSALDCLVYWLFIWLFDCGCLIVVYIHGCLVDVLQGVVIVRYCVYLL